MTRVVFDVSSYLDRIGLAEAPEATPQGLSVLVRAHRLAIPFENFDILLGRGISLKPEVIFDKLVTRRRGGYCFEQNGLFAQALQALGFVARPLLARVWLNKLNEGVPPITHQLALVTFEDALLIADVGFGGSFVPPMPLCDGRRTQDSDGVSYRLNKDVHFGWMLMRLGAQPSGDRRLHNNGEWQAQYSFTIDEVHPSDIEMGNHWTSTRPGTRFTSNLIGTRVRENGLLTLSSRTLRTIGAKEQNEVELKDAPAMSAVLVEGFGIVLDQEDVEQLFAFG